MRHGTIDLAEIVEDLSRGPVQVGDGLGRSLRLELRNQGLDFRQLRRNRVVTLQAGQLEVGGGERLLQRDGTAERGFRSAAIAECELDLAEADEGTAVFGV